MHLRILLALVALALAFSLGCSREDRLPAVQATLAMMGEPETDLDHAAVELVRVRLTLDAYTAEGMDDPAAHDEFETLQLRSDQLHELTGVQPGADPAAVRTALAAGSAFGADGTFTGDRAALFDALSSSELACERAWSHYNR